MNEARPVTKAAARNKRATKLPDGAEPPEGAAATAAGSPRPAMARTAAASARLSAPANRIVPGIPSQPSSRSEAAVGGERVMKSRAPADRAPPTERHSAPERVEHERVGGRRRAGEALQVVRPDGFRDAPGSARQGEEGGQVLGGSVGHAASVDG